MPEPFFVLATQNPIEMEGTYPLPEAQLDRFAFKISVESPQLTDLLTILDRTTGTLTPTPGKIVNAAEIVAMKQLVRAVPVASHVKDYIGRLVLNTHPETPNAPEITRKYIRFGASPRGAQAIILAAKGILACAAKPVTTSPSPISAMSLLPALRHRLILNFEGQAEGLSQDAILKRIIDATPEAASV